METPELPVFTYEAENKKDHSSRMTVARPKVLIPVFPGTNCEYDTARAVDKSGGEPEILVVRNLTPAALGETVTAMERAIRSAQMIILPGGFSGGDEPDGSGKFIASFFRNPLHRRGP